MVKRGLAVPQKRGFILYELAVSLFDTFWLGHSLIARLHKDFVLNKFPLPSVECCDSLPELVGC